jgi:hypothetical protein
MEFQHVNVKAFVRNTEEVDFEALIRAFHNWIQNQGRGELLLDVADYRHVHSGPGVVLIGHHGNYSLDNTGGRWGVRYNRKAVLEGSNQDRLAQAAQAALAACQRLEADPGLDGKIQFNGREIAISVNDRLMAPNTPETRTATDPEFRTFFSLLFGDIEYATSYPQDPSELFCVQAKTSHTFDTAALLNTLLPRSLSS